MLIDSHTHNLNESDKIEQVYICDPLNILIPKNSNFCIGAHPWFIEKINLQELSKEISIYVNHKKFFGIGEIGLDKALNTPIDKQKEVFESQINLAKKLKTNIIIHSVRSYNEIYQCLKKTKFDNKVIFHDYNSSLETTIQFQKVYDVYFSFGSSLFRKNSKTPNLLKNISIEKILLETDSQHTFDIDSVYNRASKILGIDKKTTVKQLYIKTTC